MAEHIDVTTLTQDRLNELLRQLHESSEEIAALTAERTSLQNDVARAHQAQSQAPGTPGQPAPQTSQHRSVGQPAASDGVVRHDGDDDHGTTHHEATNAARSQPHVAISAPTDDSALPSPMPLMAQRPPCFGSSQRGGPTVQALLFTLNVFFYANYVSEDTAKIRYAVSLLRVPAMDRWHIIVTKPMDYATLPTREGQTGPWAPSYFVEVPQYRTWDVWCASLRARFEPIAASIAARQKLRTRRQLVLCLVVQVFTEFQDNPTSEQHVTAVERTGNETRSTGGQVGLYHPPFEKCGLPGSSLQEGASGKTS
ncbi:unnamed protein product [Closterium sp. NIES-54]